MLENCSQKLKEDMTYLQDVFSGGNMDYFKLCLFLEEMEKRALTGDEAARTLVSIAHQFAKLSRYANKN